MCDLEGHVITVLHAIYTCAQLCILTFSQCSVLLSDSCLLFLSKFYLMCNLVSTEYTELASIAITTNGACKNVTYVRIALRSCKVTHPWHSL